MSARRAMAYTRLQMENNIGGGDGLGREDSNSQISPPSSANNNSQAGDDETLLVPMLEQPTRIQEVVDTHNRCCENKFWCVKVRMRNVKF